LVAARDMAGGTAEDIGAAIRRGVELLQQQSVETPTFHIKGAGDIYREGVRAVKSRAPANRVLQAWMDAVVDLPAPMPAAVERSVAELSDDTEMAAVVTATYKAVTANRLAKARSQRLSR